MKKPIRLLDLMFYLLESHNNPKHVAALQIFQMPPEAGDDYLITLVEQLRRLPVLEPFNFKPVIQRLGMPQWQSVENIEMEYHLRHSALPKPGNMNQLMAVAQRLHTGILDRARPGWICQVIEGLEGNRFAIYFKIHHAYIDGMSAVIRIYGSLSLDPHSEKVDAFWSHQALSEGSAKKRKQSKTAAAQLRDAGKAALSQIGAIGELNKQLLKVGMELVKLNKHTGHIPFKAPHTQVNNPLHSDLRSMGVTSMPVDQLKQIGKEAGCTLNDVVLTIIDAALHDYLARHEDDPDQPLVAMCPMSLRDADDTTANTQATILLVELGQPAAGLRKRLAQIAESARRAKADAGEMSREWLMDFAMLVMSILEISQSTGLNQILPQSSNLLVSNVPGPKTENMYLMGSRMEAIYPLTTLGAGNNLMITLLSHGNSLDFGVLAAHGTLPDIDYLVERLNRQFEALAKEFRVRATTGHKIRAKRKTATRATVKAKVRARSKARDSIVKPLSAAR